MSNAIEVTNVSHSYGSKKVLEDISLSIPSGNVVAILGENGAGKTTLVKSLLGLIRPNKGSIKVLGLDPRTDSLPLKKIVGFVPDQPAVPSWMTVSQAGWYASGFYAEGFGSRYETIANGFGLSGSDKFKNLSKGLKAKVSLSLALAMDPQLLVLDEPTSGLDLVVRKTFLEEMVDRAADGKTVWINSHQVSEVERIADWIVVIQNGQVKTIGSLEDHKNNHQLVTINVSDPVLPIPEVFRNGNTISAERSGRQWQLLVKNFEPSSAELASNSSDFSIQSAVRPSLEELYLSYSSSVQTADSESNNVQNHTPQLA